MTKQNKNGFTLVELLTVLLIISAILVIAIPSIFTISDRLSTKALNAKIDLIEKATVVYVQKNSNAIKESLGGVCNKNGTNCKCDATDPTDCKFIYKITVDKLVSLGAIKTEKNSNSTAICDIPNPKDNSKCLDCATIEVKIDDNYKNASAKYIAPTSTNETKTNCN